MLLYVMIFGAIMATCTAILWCVEAYVYVDALRNVPKAKGFLGDLTRACRILACTPKLLPLGIDILVTVWLVGAFSLTGLTGSVMGLMISNVISIFIIFISKKRANS